jgi:hypothetical protein
MDQWITDRLPTEADADKDGDVTLPWRVGQRPPSTNWQHHTLVVPGQPWWSEKAAAQVEVAAPAPAPTRKVVQIAASTGLDLFALCDDGTVWVGHASRSTWDRLPAIPQEAR